MDSWDEVKRAAGATIGYEICLSTYQGREPSVPLGVCWFETRHEAVGWAAILDREHEQDYYVRAAAIAPNSPLTFPAGALYGALRWAAEARERGEI